MSKDYFQLALQTFNDGDWYTFKKEDDNGNVIPNSDRMQYQYVKIIKDGATMPSEAEVNAKMQELQDKDANRPNLKASAKAKLIAGEALTEEEANILVGV
jgi:hypothetical protein|tara:strand:- start:15 stop:314 length:300 start_codon:yes stop_codon:yes gene_type:complete